MLQEISNEVNQLIGLPLLTAFRYAQTELFCFGFGVFHEEWDEKENCLRRIPTYALHVQCEFHVVCRKVSRVIRMDGMTQSPVFDAVAQKLQGLTVRHAFVEADGYALCLELGDFLLRVIPYEDEEEGWRLFRPNTDALHLVVNDQGINREL